MATFQYLDTEYLWGRADETIQTIIVNHDKVVYCHYKNGYYSYIIGVQNLYNFLAGDTDARFFCSEDEEAFEKISELF